MHANAAPCTRLVLKTEGGYVNDRQDPGGPTCKGITIATARACIDPSFTLAQLRMLTDDQAIIVYEARYWDAIRADDLPSGVDYVLYDYAVNSGPARAIRVIQSLCGVTQDGKLGPKTLAALASFDTASVIEAVTAERLAFMRGLKTWSRFGKGWSTRVNGVREHSLALAKAANDNVPAPLYTPAVVQGKAMVAPASGAKAGSGVAGTAAAMTAWASAAHVGGYVAMGVSFLAVGGVAAAIWAIDKNQQAANLTPAPTSVVPLPKAA